MMIAGVAMIVIAIGVAAMKAALNGVTWGKIGMMAAVIVGLALAMGLAGAGPVPGFIALGSAAMIVAGISLLVIAAGVKVLSMALKDVTLEKAGIMGAVIIGLGAAMALAGLAAPFIILGSAAMIVAGVATAAVGASRIWCI